MIGHLATTTAKPVYWRASAVSSGDRSTEHAARGYPAEALRRLAVKRGAVMGPASTFAVYRWTPAACARDRSTIDAARRHAAKVLPGAVQFDYTRMGSTATVASNRARQIDSRSRRSSSGQPPIQSDVAMGNPQYVATDDNRTTESDLSPAVGYSRFGRRSALGFSTRLAVFRPYFGLEAGRSAPQGASEDFAGRRGAGYRLGAAGEAQMAQE